MIEKDALSIHLKENGIISIDKSKNREAKELAHELIQFCLERKVSYTTMNKALYLADKKLYRECLNKIF
ncbi:hypothetical protein IV286_05990 [Enterococcus faecium]|uniref:hypothetical protein n=1 Tax=Enterococcus faecium TaxID=1352 RepID=UPI0019F57698|nr:hypothetical protein [Enterococcus faecium]MCD5204545.1 hypothetical protein [Enterococcus faecium]MCD5214687.1 hypothetical protein [Enterococcus faecium]MCD5224828.1 hypothetical protein [Enterococcus faecium]